MASNNTSIRQVKRLTPHKNHLYYWNENYHLYEFYNTTRGPKSRLIDGDFGQYSDEACKITADEINEIYHTGDGYNPDFIPSSRDQEPVN